MRIIRPMLLGILMAVCSSCDPAAESEMTGVDRWQNAADYIEQETQRPSIFGELDRTAPFFTEQYVPRLKKGAEKLPSLRNGEIKTFVIASIYRPVAEYRWVFWILWIRPNDDPRTLVLSDPEGELIALNVPPPDEDLETAARLFQIEVFELYCQPAGSRLRDDWGHPAKQFEIPRPLGEVSARILSLAAPGDRMDESVTVVPLPGGD